MDNQLADHVRRTGMNTATSTVRVVLLTLLAAGVRGIGLAGRQLPTDEAITLAFVQQLSPRELVTVLPQLQPHFPAYYLLLDGWLAVAGATPLNARIVSAAAGALTVPVVYLLGTDLYSQRGGLAAALLCALSPFHIALSQVVRMYAVMGLVAAVSWYALLKGRPRVYAATAIVTAYLHYFGILVVAGHALYLGYRSRWRPSRQWLRTLGGVTATALPGITWVAYRTLTETAGSTVRVVGLTPPTPATVARLPVQFLLGEIALGTGEFIAVGLLAASGCYLVHGIQHYGNLRPSRLTVFATASLLVPAAVLVVVSYALKPVFRARYIIMAALALYVVGGAFIARLSRPVRGVAVALLLVSAAVATPTAYATGPSEWNRANAYLDQHVDETDTVVIVGLWSREADIRAQQIDAEVVESRRQLQHVPEQTFDGVQDVYLVQYAYWGQVDRPDLQNAGIASTHEIASATQVSDRLVIYRIHSDDWRPTS